MSGGKAARRKKQKWRRAQRYISAWPCPHCGSTEPHFIPPSFGDRGFYACSMVAREPTDPSPEPFLDHAYRPGKFSDACQVMLARYPCPYPPEAHPEPNQPESEDA